MARWIGIVMVGLLAGGFPGCASGPPAINEGALARLPPAALENVNEQRLEVSRANDELARAQARVRDAEAERDLARHEQKVAGVSEDHGYELLDVGRTQSDPARIDEGKRAIDVALVRKDAAKAHEEAADARIDFAQAEKSVAIQHSDLARLHLEQSKHEALKRAEDPAAAKSSDEEYATAIEAGEAGLRDAEARVEKARERLAERAQIWQAKQRRFEAAAPVRPSGG